MYIYIYIYIYIYTLCIYVLYTIYIYICIIEREIYIDRYTVGAGLRRAQRLVVAAAGEAAVAGDPVSRLNNSNLMCVNKMFTIGIKCVTILQHEGIQELSRLSSTTDGIGAPDPNPRNLLN